MKDFIIEPVDEKLLTKIADKVMGFTSKTPIEILDHIDKRGGDVRLYQQQ